MAERDLFSMPSGLVPKPSPSAQGRKPPSTVGEKRKTCNCRNSRCLKLYCECFASGQYCYGCNCQSCFNNPENDELRKQAIESTLERNQQAFRPKISSTEQAASAHNRGCNCKKSGCLKKYCECYQAGIKCADTCKCVNCLNRNEGQKVVLPSPAPKRQRSATGAAAVAGATPASRLGSASDGLITPRAASGHLSAGHRMAISRSLLATPTAPALPTPLQLARVAIGECLTDEVLEGLYGALLDPEIAAMDLEQQEAAVLSLVHRALHQALSAARRAASHHLPTASAAPSVVSSSSGAVAAMPTPAPVTAHVPMTAPAAAPAAGSTSAVTGAVQAGAVTGAVQAAVHWPHSRAPAAEFRAAVAAAAAGTDAAPTTGNGGAVVSNGGAVVSNGGAAMSTGGAAIGATGGVCSSGGPWKRVTTAAAAATATAAASSTAAATTSGGGRPVPWAPIVTPAATVPPSQPPLSVATAATAAAAAAATAAATGGGFAPLALSGAAMPGTGAVSGTIHGAVSGTVHRAVSGTPSGAGSGTASGAGSGTPSGAGSGTVGGAVSGTPSGVSYAGGTSRTKPVPSAVPSASKGGVQWLSMPAASSVAASGPERSRPNDIRNLVPMYQLPSSSTAPPTAAIAATMQQPPTLSTSAAPTHPPTSAAASSPRQPQPHRK